jgi:hypothetical protein
MKLITLLFIGMAAVVLTANAADKKIDVSKLPPASKKQGVTFDKDIKPIFEQSCFKCHSAKAEKLKGKLKLDSLEDALKGGDNGVDVVANKPAESPLLISVAHIGDEDDFMPPPKNKAGIKALTSEEVGLIRAWIEQGAK